MNATKLQKWLCHTGVIALLFIGTIHRANAATRTFCWSLAFLDSRQDGPPAGGQGVRRGTHAGGLAPATGQTIQIWDYDPTGGDDFIANVRITNENYENCFVFEWESIAAGEQEPDPYVIWPNVAGPSVTGGQTDSKQIRIADINGVAFPSVTWRNLHVNNCIAGAACWIAPGNTLIPVSDTATTHAAAIMAADTAQHVLAQIHDSLPANTIVTFKVDPNNLVGGASALISSIPIDKSDASSALVPAHEYGHTVQQNIAGGIFFQVNYMKAADDGWDWDSIEFDSASTIEGFATYVEHIAWYSPGNSSPAFSNFQLVVSPLPTASVAST